MNRILLFALVATIEAISSASYAQKISYNPNYKVKDSFHQHYVGGNGDNEFLLVSNLSMKKDYLQVPMSNSIQLTKQVIKLVKFDSKFQLKTEYPVAFKPELDFLIDAIVVGNEIRIFYRSTEDKNDVFILRYSLNGALLADGESETGKIELDDEKYARKPMIIRSENRNYSCLLATNQMIFFDKNFERIWKPSLTYTYVNSVKVMDDGSALAVGQGSTGFVAARYDLENKLETLAKWTSDVKLQDRTVKVFGQELYVIARYSTYKDSDSRHFFSNGILVNIFDISDMKKKSSYKVKFSDDILLSISNKKKISKVKGLDFVEISNAHLTKDGEIITILRKHQIHYPTGTFNLETSNMRRSETSPELRNEYGNIFIIKSTSATEFTQRLIEARSQANTTYSHLLGNISEYVNDSLYILHNEGISSYELTQTVLNKDLDVARNTVTNTYKTAGVYYGIRDAIKVGAHQYFVLGRYQNNIGSMLIHFK